MIIRLILGGVILYIQGQIESQAMYKVKSQNIYKIESQRFKSQIEIVFSVVGQQQLRQSWLVLQPLIHALMGQFRWTGVNGTTITISGGGVSHLNCQLHLLLPQILYLHT